MDEIRGKAQKLLDACVALLAEPQWKEYGRLSVGREWSQGDEQEMLEAMLALDEALALIPPEGKTLPLAPNETYGLALWIERECFSIEGKASDVLARINVTFDYTKAAEEIERYVQRRIAAEPAPFSEKAIRKARKIIKLLRYWTEPDCYEGLSKSDEANLYEINRFADDFLASSSAPSNKGESD